MSLVRLTLVGVSKTPIYLNPAHIVSVIQFEKHTSILTTAVGKDGEPKKYNVVEAPHVVAELVVDRADAPAAVGGRAA
nr:hypothetical protein [uncultured Shinella sp.]